MHVQDKKKTQSTVLLVSLLRGGFIQRMENGTEKDKNSTLSS